MCSSKNQLVKGRRYDIRYHDQSQHRRSWTNMEVVLTFLVPLLVVGLIIAGICLKVSAIRGNRADYEDHLASMCERCPMRNERSAIHQAGFVALVRIRGPGSPTSKDMVRYPITLLETYKRQSKYFDFMTPNAIFAPIKTVDARQHPRCVVKFDQDVAYLITGKIIDFEPVVTECDLQIPWYNRTEHQRSDLIGRMVPLFDHK